MNEVYRDSGVENGQGAKGLVQREKKDRLSKTRKEKSWCQASPLPLGLALCTDIA